MVKQTWGWGWKRGHTYRAPLLLAYRANSCQQLAKSHSQTLPNPVRLRCCEDPYLPLLVVHEARLQVGVERRHVLAELPADADGYCTHRLRLRGNTNAMGSVSCCHVCRVRTRLASPRGCGLELCD